jgi:phosphotransferase system IIB component
MSVEKELLSVENSLERLKRVLNDEKRVDRREIEFFKGYGRQNEESFIKIIVGSEKYTIFESDPLYDFIDKYILFEIHTSITYQEL